MPSKVTPKKRLGQHFLKDMALAERIATSLTAHEGYENLWEVGPGMGVLTQFLLEDKRFELGLIELDQESVLYLSNHFVLKEEQLIEGDFLKLPNAQLFSTSCGLIGNFPYNISSQIFFRVFENHQSVKEVVGMVQKEVAERITSVPGKKSNGILSILLQVYYKTEYLFTVPPDVFDPPPKVNSAVLRLKRNKRENLPIPESKFVRLVKQAFNNRRKTLWNALKPLALPDTFREHHMMKKRAEQLSTNDFIELAIYLQSHL